jgi:type IV pilus assembly protein PilB
MPLLDSIPIMTKNSLKRQFSRVQGIPEDQVHLSGIKDSDLQGAVGIEFNSPFIELSNELVDRSIIDMFSPEVFTTYQFLPLFRSEKSLFVASPTPWNIFIRDSCREHMKMSDLDVHFFLITEKDLTEYLRANKLGSGLDSASKAEGLKYDTDEDTYKNSTDLTPEDASTWGVLSQLFIEALAKEATDVHIVPEEDRVRIRADINGSLVDFKSLPRSIGSSIEHVIYNKTQTMFSHERMKPQDGNISFDYETRKIDLRIASVPTYSTTGEVTTHITIRFQDSRRNDAISFTSLGFEPATEKNIIDSIESPGVLCIIAGPTGSGKTTTLGACMKHLNTEERNIYSVEDPVENRIHGIAHVLVKGEVTFAGVLKALLRKKPHVIMVGEIRDQDAGRVVIEAALTGHTVLTTVHADYASEIPERLFYAGIEPWQVASKLQLCSSQRLIKVICPYCSQEYIGKEEDIINYAYPKEFIGKQLRKAHKEGCDRCFHTGYIERKAIIEVMPFNDELRDMIANGAKSRAIQKYAVEKLGMKSLKHLALECIEKGLTDYDGIKHVINLKIQ